jgi:hypothetical protein
MGCALVERRDLERAVYRQGWMLGATPLFILMFVAALFLFFA